MNFIKNCNRLLTKSWHGKIRKIKFKKIQTSMLNLTFDMFNSFFCIGRTKKYNIFVCVTCFYNFI